jgi:hypothetical protein
MKLEFPWQNCEKSSNIKFHEIMSSGSRVVPSGRTDRHDKATVAICELVKKNKATPLPRFIKETPPDKSKIFRVLHSKTRVSLSVNYTRTCPAFISKHYFYSSPS